MDTRDLFDRLHRDPRAFPLFDRIYQVLQFAPSCRHASEESLVSLAADALDYLQADGRWQTAAPTGRTVLTWDGRVLHVQEDDDRQWNFERSFAIHTQGWGQPGSDEVSYTHEL